MYHIRNVSDRHWDGIIRRFYENGNLLGTFPITNGTIEGLTNRYDTNGILVKQIYIVELFYSVIMRIKPKNL